MATRFPGLPAEGLRFLRDLARNNNREWFQANKHVYEEQLRAPMMALVEAVNNELTSFAPEHVAEPKKSVYRIYRDTRFSKDKTPYKTHIAANFPRRGLDKHSGGGYYFHIEPAEIIVAGGVYMPGSPELIAIRNHIAERHDEFTKLLKVKTLRTLLGELQGEKLTRPPKGFAADHPAIDLLRHKQLYFYASMDPELATTPKLLTEVVKRFKAMTPVVDFLNAPLVAMKRKTKADPLTAAVAAAPASRRRAR